jgi:hypothetical protein
MSSGDNIPQKGNGSDNQRNDGKIIEGKRSSREK